MKVGDKLLFSISGTGYIICPVQQTGLDIVTKAFDYPVMGHGGGVKVVSFQVRGGRKPITCPVSSQSNMLTTAPPRPPYLFDFYLSRPTYVAKRGPISTDTLLELNFGAGSLHSIIGGGVGVWLGGYS